MNIDVINKGRKMCLDGTMKFPAFVQELINIGIERYTIDLVSLKATYYSMDNEVYITDFEYEKLSVAREFQHLIIKEAILEVQQGKINYQAFLHHVIAAGCCSYEVFITGKKAIYLGRDGSYHIENFPAGK